ATATRRAPGTATRRAHRSRSENRNFHRSLEALCAGGGAAVIRNPAWSTRQRPQNFHLDRSVYLRCGRPRVNFDWRWRISIARLLRMSHGLVYPNLGYGDAEAAAPTR